jgi:hypothetical protein
LGHSLLGQFETFCRFWLRTSWCAVGPFWSLRRWLRVAAQRSYHGFLMTSNKVRSYVSEVPEDSAWSRGGGPPLTYLPLLREHLLGSRNGKSSHQEVMARREAQWESG